MDSTSFKFAEEFISFIQHNIPGSKIVSGGREIVCRCKYCPDSRDINHGHMYISVPQSEYDPILFHCFKCQTSGVLDSRTLMDWGIYDPIIGTNADNINKKASRRRNTNYNRIWYRFAPHIDDYNLANTKLNYLNNRLGTNLTIDDCNRNKIILNLKDSVDFTSRVYGYDYSYTRHPNIIYQLNKYFVGFLSLDNNFINLRRICDEGIVHSSIDKRYINYNIHAKNDNTEKMYIIPTEIDMSKPIKVNIHIAEGPMDILSIKFNLRKNDTDIFAAVTGSGYKGLVMHLISTFKIFFFDLHVYPDNDKFGDRRMVQELYEMIKPYGATLYEHRNMFPNEKDFGVDLGHIDEKIYIYN